MRFLRAPAARRAANIHPAAQPHLHLGRPDIPRLFARVADMCVRDGVRRVAVVTCGPAPMVHEVTALCAARHKGVAFDLHCEVFNF